MSEQTELDQFIEENRSVRAAGKPIVLFSDIDGTLVSHDMKISERDRSAIGQLMAGGHFFALATGRGRTNAEFHMKNLETNFPAIFANGSLLYDRRKSQVLLQHEMETGQLEELFGLMKRYYPQIMIQIYTADAIYLITDNPADDPRVSNHQPYERIQFSEIKGMKCNKVLFGMQDENCDGGRDIADGYVREHLTELRVVKSQSKYIELTPAMVSKGRMLEYVKEHTDALIAVAGDYYNDIEMMQAADISYTLSTSPDEVIEAADEVLETRPGSFISLVIEDLLKRFDQGL